jgi:hypothetical protein
MSAAIFQILFTIGLRSAVRSSMLASLDEERPMPNPFFNTAPNMPEGRALVCAGHTLVAMPMR